MVESILKARQIFCSRIHPAFSSSPAMNTFRLFVIFTLLIPGIFVSGQDSWPEFRGPTGQGHSSATKIPTKWSETENVTWRTKLPGKGWSSPVIEKE